MVMRRFRSGFSDQRSGPPFQTSRSPWKQCRNRLVSNRCNYIYINIISLYWNIFLGCRDWSRWKAPHAACVIVGFSRS